MPFIMNALTKEVSTDARGTWFSFKPKQIKNIADEHLADFFASNRAHEGLVRLSDGFEDPDYKASEAGKQELADASQRGLEARVNFLTYVVNNELSGLKKDLMRNNDPTDPRTYMSKGMIANMEELAGYKSAAQKAKTDQLNKIADLEKLINESTK